MYRNTTAGERQNDKIWMTADMWFAGGRHLSYDANSARVLTSDEAATRPGVLRVLERTTTFLADTEAVWLTMLPGFPDGSYGWAQVDRLLPAELGPRLYVEPIGQGDKFTVSTLRMAARDPIKQASYHHGNLHQALVEAGTELAREGGPSANVLREAARRVGVSPNAAYRPFNALPELVEAVALEPLPALARSMEAALTKCRPSGGRPRRGRTSARGRAR
jgi:hypothetical protein